MAECDYMESVVESIERDLNVRVQRFDIVRDRWARILYDKLDESNTQRMPLLYHRESRQSIYGPVDTNRVRAWAKGRWLSANYRPTLPTELIVGKARGGRNKLSKSDRSMSGNHDGDDGDDYEGMGGEYDNIDSMSGGGGEMELVEDDSHLSPRQKEGKEAMRRRLERGIANAKKKG